MQDRPKVRPLSPEAYSLLFTSQAVNAKEDFLKKIKSATSVNTQIIIIMK